MLAIIKISFEDRLEALKNRIKNTPVLGGFIEGIIDAATILNYKGFAWNERKVYENIFTDLMDDPSKEGVETGIPMLAVSPNAGLISYEFYKEGVLQGPGAIRYVPVTYLEDKKFPEAVYFIKEGQDDFL